LSNNIHQIAKYESHMKVFKPYNKTKLVQWGSSTMAGYLKTNVSKQPRAIYFPRLSIACVSWLVCVLEIRNGSEWIESHHAYLPTALLSQQYKHGYNLCTLYGHIGNTCLIHSVIGNTLCSNKRVWLGSLLITDSNLNVNSYFVPHFQWLCRL